MANKYHFYIITIQSEKKIASSVRGLSSNKVTRPDIASVMQKHGIPDAIILSVSYLGYMSNEEYETGIPDAEDFI